VYKGRIQLDTSEVIDVPDGKGKEKLVFNSLIFKFPVSALDLN
jgi:hypothetical protein